MIDLGIVKPGETIYVPFGSYAGSTGASAAMTGLATSDIKIYKDGSVTERASTSGYVLLDTDGLDFDGLTGINGVSIDLADNTTAGFWAAGARYFVVIADVTVDSQTVRFLPATFKIGLPGAVLNTTIATLSSQTSFTLTAGPAEDDSLNGAVVYIHDVASAVQGGFAVVLDYIGATKTVTLAAGTTFTAAASDNVMVMPPSNVSWAAATAWNSGAIGPSTLAADTITAAKIADGAIDAATFAAGAINAAAIASDAITDAKVAADVTIASVTGAVGSVAGNVDGNVTGSVGSVAAGGITASSIAADAIGASELAADAVAEISAAVWAETTRLLTAGTNIVLAKGVGVTGFNDLSAAAVNAEVDTAIADAALATAANLATVLADTNELQTDWADGGRLDLILDARSSQTSVDTIDGIVDAILVDTAEIGAAGAGLTALASATDLATVGTAVDAVKVTTDKLDNTLSLTSDGYVFNSIALQGVWDESIAGHLTAGTTGAALNAAGSAGDPWGTALPGGYVAGTAGYMMAAIDDLAAKMETMLQVTSDGYAYTENSLEFAPSGGSAPSASEIADEVQMRTIAAVTVVNGLAANSVTAAALAADAGSEIGTAVWATAARTLTALDEDSTTLDLDATIRAAVGMAAANLDTQLGLIDAKTTNLPSDPADESLVIAATNAIAALIGTPVVTVAADLAGVKAQTVAIETDTQDIQGRIPGALVDGKMNSTNSNTVIRCTVDAGSNSTSLVLSAIDITGTLTLDQLKGRIVLFDKATTTEGLRGEGAAITGSTAANPPTLTINELSDTPQSGDSLTIV